MNRNSRLMILTASYGDGHIQAARALEQGFLKEGIHSVQIIDLMQEAYPYLNTLTRTLYVKSAQASTFGLDYYGWSYYMTRNSRQQGPWGKWFNLLGKKKLKELVRMGRPDAIINTFPFGAASEIGRDLDIPTFTVVTDFTLHTRWIHPDIDKYYVAAEELKAEMTSKGVDSGHIEVTGIPIRHAFYQAVPSRSALRQQFDPTKKVVLISAGSFGVLKHMENIIQSLLTRDNCQLAVVCGRNQKLEDRLYQLYATNPSVHIFGFIENIHELMTISSCIVTKAGGLTLTEALTLQLPIFIFKPFAGQEKENALFLARKGAAEISRNTDELKDQLHHFLSDKTYASLMKSNMVALRKDAATRTITKDVIHSMGQRALQTV
jgi:processive 1,2-diacylglycerol beta-glucosyltransferase